ncbi:MAG: phosphoribosylformylglycinamidine synthase subunit PurS [Thermodesulfobacteriota bacterium]
MSEYKVKVVVRLKPVVLDPQGKTVLSALRNLGFSQVQDTRVSKFIEMDVKGDNPAIVKEQVEQMCSKLLANPVIEDYEIEVME